MNDKINVVLKIKPLIGKEKDIYTCYWDSKQNSIFQIDPTTKKIKGESFSFDHIFNQYSTNQDIFSTVVQPIIDATIQGFNGTVIAYGQTSSGKTHTMTGTLVEPGIIPTAIKYMFSLIEKDRSREYLLRVSYLEIYNEKVNDLLGNTENIVLREDGDGQTTVKVEERVCNNIDKVLDCMAKGEKNRRIGETNMNERSSRSHTIFRVILESSTRAEDDDDDDEGFVKTSQLNLVDLAGSERCGQSGTTGERFKEGCHINNSLTVLSLVIKQLSELNDDIPESLLAKEKGLKQTDTRQHYINYRGSKLTRLLKTSLGGNALTVIICTVTPTVIDQTQNTINFALRSKNVKNKPELNEAADDAALIKRYMRQIANLSQELEEKEKKIAKLKKDFINSSISDTNENKMDRSKRRRTWGGKTDLFPLLPTRFLLSTINEDPSPSTLKRSTSDISGFSLAVKELECDLTEIKTETSDEPREQNIWNRNVGPLKHLLLDNVTKIDVCETPPRILRERIESETKLAKLLENEYKQLKEFTTLEKQIFHTDGRKLEEDNKILDEKFCIALSQISQLTADKDQLQTELEENVSTLEKLKSKLIDIEVIKENTEKRFLEREKELKRSLEDSWDTLKMKNATIDHLKEDIDQLHTKLRVNGNNTENIILLENNKLLKHDLKQLEEKCQREQAELNEEIKKIRNENRLLVQQSEIVEDQNKGMKTQIEILEAKLKELENSLIAENKCQENIALLDIRDKEVTKNNDNLNTLLSTNQKVNEPLLEKNKILEHDLTQLEEKCQREQSELSEEIIKIRNENRLLVQQSEIVEDQNKGMKTQIEILEAKLKELENSLIAENKCRENIALLDIRDKEVTENNEYPITLLSTNQEVNEPLLEKNKILEHDLKQLEEKCQREQAELSEEIIKIRNENRLLVQQSEIVEDQNKGMKTQIEILEAKLKELENSLIAENKCRENIALLHITDKEVTEYNDNLITLLSTNQEVNEPLLEKNKILEHDLKQLEEKCQREQAELSEEIIKIQNENRLLVQQSEIVEDQNKGMKTQIEILEAKLKELESPLIVENKCQENIALLDIRDKEVTENNDILNTLLSTNQKVNEPLLEKNKILEHDLKQLEEKCQREQSELSEEIIKIRNENRLLVQQSEIVEDQNKGMKTQIEILEAKLKELENSLIAENKCRENIALLDIRDKEVTENNDNLNTLLSTNQKVNEPLLEKNKILEHDLKQLEEKCQREQAELSEEIIKIQNENRLLVQQSEIVEDQNKGMKTQIEILEAKLKELENSSIVENKCQENIALLDIRDKEVTENNDNLNTLLSTNQKVNEPLLEKNKILEHDLKQLEEKCQREQSELSEEIIKIRNENRLLVQQSEIVEDQNKGMKTQIEILEAKLKELENSLIAENKCQENIALLDIRDKEVTENNDNLNILLSTNQKVNEPLLEKNKILEHDLKQLEEKCQREQSELSEEIIKIRNENRLLVQQSEIVEDQNKGMKTQIEILEAKLKELENSLIAENKCQENIALLDIRDKEVTENNDNLNILLSTNQKVNEPLLEKNKILEHDLKQLEEKCQREQAELSEEIIKIRNENRLVVQQSEIVEDQNKGMKTQIEILEAKLKELENSLIAENKCQENIALLDIRDKEVTENNEYPNTLLSTNQEVNEPLLKKNKILEHDLKQLEEKCQREQAELSEEIIKIRRENRLLVQQSEIVEDQNKGMKTQIKILEAKLKELESPLIVENKCQENIALLDIRDREVTENNEYPITLLSTNQEVNEPLLEKNKILEHDLKQLEEKCQREQAELSEEIIKIQNENRLLVQQSEIVEDQNKGMKTQIEILEAKLKELENSLIVENKCQENIASLNIRDKEVTEKNENPITLLSTNQEVVNSTFSKKSEDGKNYTDITSTIDEEKINHLETTEENVSSHDEEQMCLREEEYVAELRRRNIILFEKVQDITILKEKIINEIMSLDSSIKDNLKNFELIKLFETFMTVLMKKEGDIILKIKDDFELQTKELQEKYKQLEGQEKKLKNWIHTIEDENERLCDKLATMKQNIEHLQLQVSEKNNEVKEKDMKLTLMDKKVLSLQEASLNIQTELNDIKNEHSLCKIPDNFNTRLSKLEDDLKKKDIMIKIEEEKVNKLLMQEIQMLTLLESEKKKNQELLDINNNQSEELHLQQEDCKRYKDELKIKNEEFNNLILETKHKENEYNLHVNQLKKKLIELETQDFSKEYEQLLFNLSDCPLGLKNKLNLISNHFKLFKRVIEVFINKLEQEELIGMQQIKDLEVAFKEKDKICQELQTKLSNFESNESEMMKELKAKDDVLEEVIKNLEKERMAYSQIFMKSGELQSYLNATKMERDKYKKNLIEARKELENLKTECKSEENNIKLLTEEVKILSQQLTQLNNRNEGFLNKIGEVIFGSPSDLNDVLHIVSEKMIFITELQEKLETMHILNQKLISECTSTNESINQINEKILNIVVQKESCLDEQYNKNSIQDISQVNYGPQSNDFVRKVLDIIPGKPSNLAEAFFIISNNFKEIEQLKVNAKTVEEEKDYLDKECDMLYKLLKDNEKYLDSYSRQCSEKTAENIDLKVKIAETERHLEEKVKLCDSLLEDKNTLKLEVSRYEDMIREHRKEKGKMILQISECKCKLRTSERDLEDLKLQLNEQKKILDTRSLCDNDCLLEELKNKVNELTMSVSERDMKIITLELQIQNDTIPLKNQIIELEKSLDQAKQMIKEFKSESQEYKKLLQNNCEKCRKQVELQLNSPAQASSFNLVPATPNTFLEGQSFLEQKVQQLKNEIMMLKRLCRSRDKRIEELEKLLKKEKPIG